VQQPALNPDHLFSYVTLVLIGRAIRYGDEIALGAGPDIAALEIGRVIGPLFAIGIGVLLCWYVARRWPWTSADQPRGSAGTTRLLWSWIAGCLLCIIALSGFPFLYRTVFVTSVFFTITATELFTQLLAGSGPQNTTRRRLAGGIAGISITALVIGLYAFGWGLDYPSASYQAAFRVWEFTGLALVLLFAALTLARSRRTQIVGLAATIGLAVALDRAGLAVLLMPHTFGKPPEPVKIVAHYDASDLTAARWLHDNERMAVLISDPYTIGTAQAITGAPGLYLFSNLDTVNEAVADLAKAVIADIVEPASKEEKTGKICVSVARMLVDLNAEAQARIKPADRSVAMLRPVRPALDEENRFPPTVDAKDAAHIWKSMLQTSEGPEWTVAAIINPRTIKWLHLDPAQRLSYFPSDEPLDPGIVDSLKAGPFSILFFDAHTAIVSLGCSDAGMKPGDKP
jgi:hypothetical protein